MPEPASVAAQAAAADHTIQDFRFASGETLPELKLHYRTLGSPACGADGQATNAVLMLHGTTGSGAQFLQPSTADHLFGAGQPLDTGRYFVILPDAIGHGGSSKPSDGLGSRFPRYGYGDIVDAQHRLVTEGLGLKRLRLVLGTSMGGMQTWMWGERHPDMMDALMPIASLPERVGGRNLLWRRMLVAMIRSDPACGNGKEQPPNLGAAWNLFKLMVDSPAHLAGAFDGADAADAHVRQVAEEALRDERADDVVWEFEASRDYDPAPGLGKIEAPLLAVNFADDELNPVELGGLDRAIAKVKRGHAVTLPADPKSRGHQTLAVAEVWGPCVAELLHQTETAQAAA